MAGVLDNRQVLVKIFFGILVGILGVSMLLYLVPQAHRGGARGSVGTLPAHPAR